jgi:hypothetical protein
MSNDLMKSESKSFEVVELDDGMLDSVVGGKDGTEVNVAADCGTTNHCPVTNSVAGCGG